MRLTLMAALLAYPVVAAELHFTAQETVTGFEMNQGDTLRFTLRNGQVRTMLLERTEARVLLTNLRERKKPQPDGGLLYEMVAYVRIDGHPMRLVRYVGVQESFAEPYVVNGMRLWLDAVDGVFAFLADNHGGQAGCRLNKQARFAVNDARDRVAPVELHAWYPIRSYALDIGNSYNGDDPYMGAYQGSECHAGLDINQPKGTPLFAPIDFEDHFLFNSLAKGDNNNRWRGLHTWPNGDRWTLQAHHLVELIIPEHQPVAAGTPYGVAAGVLPGSNEHSHFMFRTQHPGGEDVLLDPWILFWQFFEQERQRRGEIRAVMDPLSPARTGERVAFHAGQSRKGPWGRHLDHYWTFGDGGFSRAVAPVHVYARPGVYAVTLTVDDGVDRAVAAQVITVDGSPSGQSSLALQGIDEMSFLQRRPEAREVYGVRPKTTPHSIRIVARWGESLVRTRGVRLENVGGGALAGCAVSLRYEGRGGWLEVVPRGAGNSQVLTLRAAAKGLTPAYYRAVVSVACPGALNSPQEFEMVLDVRQNRPPAEVVVDSSSDTFLATPYFWIEHKLRAWKPKGYGGSYLTNGGRAEAGQAARFTPVLRAGRYQVELVEETPFAIDPEARFAVRVKHKSGEQQMWIEPFHSRVIGTFEFEEGTDGFVEVLAKGSRGQVLVDAVRFRPAPL